MVTISHESNISDDQFFNDSVPYNKLVDEISLRLLNLLSSLYEPKENLTCMAYHNQH